MYTGSKRLTVVVVAVLLLTSGVADDVTALSRSEHVTEEPGDPSVATNVTRSNTLTVDANAAVGLGLRADTLDDRLATLAHRERLAASSSENQTAVLAVELRSVRRATNRLETRQTDTLAQHAQRNVTTEKLLFELARIDAAAHRLERRRDAAVTRLDDLSAAGVDTRTLRADLMTLRGPVREQVATIAVGATNGTVVSVETSRRSVALGVYTDRTALVERYRADYLDASTDDPATIEGVTELIATTYPDEWENRTGYTIRRIDADLLYVEFEYTEGTIVAYIDRPTGLIFKEFHYGPLATDADRFDRFLPGD